MVEAHSTGQNAVIGNLNDDFWIYDSENGYDLTRPSPPTAQPRSDSIKLQTSTVPITIDPSRSALVVIDMQNFFLSTAMGRSPDSKGLKAQEQLIKYAIPAARKAGIQLVWLNWGLSEFDLLTLPPAVHRAFGFSKMSRHDFDAMYCRENPQTTSPTNLLHGNDLGKDPGIYKGLGQSLGDVTLANGIKTSAGRMLMRDQWNTKLPPGLEDSFKSSLETDKPDAWINKNRVSGIHLPGSPAGLYFQNHDIKTLFFAGVNTDQCVVATITDAFCQGYDCIMLSDACATTSPAGAQECVENNVGRTMGFLLDCEGFARDISTSIGGRG